MHHFFLLLLNCMFIDIASGLNPREWCRYIRKTPEPQILVYNRIPKCGSSTVQRAVNIIESHSFGRLSYVAFNSSYWGHNYDEDDVAQAHLYEKLQADIMSTPNTTMVIDGHWPWHTIPQFDERKVGYFQMTRKCEDRALSSIKYSLFSSREARVAKQFKYSEKYLSKVLNTNLTDAQESVDACLNSKECLENSMLMQPNNPYSVVGGLMAKYHCGAKCVAEHEGSILKGSLNKVANPAHGYTIVGLMENMQDSFRLFQCAFPTAFRAAEKLYRTNAHLFHVRPSVEHNVTLAMDMLIHGACTSIDAPLYDETKRIFDKRMAYINKYPHRCCRQLPGKKFYRRKRSNSRLDSAVFNEDTDNSKGEMAFV